MKKRVVITVLIGIIGVSLAFFILLNSFSPSEETSLSDLQITACKAADKGKTCFTELPKLELVSPQDCCKALGKCCQ